MTKTKKILTAVIGMLVILVVGLGAINRNSGKKAGAGLVIRSGGKEITLSFDDIEKDAFSGDLVNGKGESHHHDYEGIELKTLLSGQKMEITNDSTISVTSEDNYSADIFGNEVLEGGKVYIAFTADGTMIEGIEGGQGAQLIVLGDSNSKRAVRYMKYINVTE